MEKSPTPSKKKVDHGPVGTSTRQIAGYFTVSGIQNETTGLERSWPEFAFKENCDNAYDWLNDFYSISEPVNNYDYKIRRHIAISVRINAISGDPDQTRIFSICVRNSNIDEIRIQEFESPEQIFSCCTYTDRLHFRLPTWVTLCCLFLYVWWM